MLPSCTRTVDVGAYVLGSLEPAERATVEAHLPTCAACSAELTELAGLPGLLSRLTLGEAVQSADPAPASVLDGILAQIRRRHRRRQIAVTGVAAAVAAAVAVIVFGAGLGLTATHDGSLPPVLTATAGPITARATLRAVAAGTAIDLDLTGVPASTRCRLVVVATDGATIDAGTWYATYDGQAGVHQTAALNRADVSALRIETLNGHTLITVPAAGT